MLTDEICWEVDFLKMLCYRFHLSDFLLCLFFFFFQGTCVKAWDWEKSREEGNGVVIGACFPWIRILMFCLRMVLWGNNMAQQRLVNSVTLGK